MPTESGYSSAVTLAAGDPVCSRARLRAAMLLEHGRHGPDAPRLADVGVLGQAILGADDVGAEPQSAPAGLPSGRGASVCSQ